VLTPRIKARDPVGLASNDGAAMCRCDDGFEYVVKDTTAHPLTPHNEWFCTHLAGLVGIVCPPCCPVEDETGQLVFGSRCEGGVTSDPWVEKVVRGEIDRAVIDGVLSRILAFDHFVHNDDRHLRNYLVRTSRNGWAMLAMDFSRAWSFHGFPPGALPFTLTQKTRLVHRTIKREIGDFVDVPEVNRVLDALSAVKGSEIEKILDRQPTSWLTRAKKNDIIGWWKSPDRAKRIASIRKGIGDGSYL
jgi:hypothetical protein